MTEQHSPEPREPHDEERLEQTVMPRWVPLLIGGVLVLIAAFAVFTGLRYRAGDTLLDQVRPQSDRRQPSSAPPGEPDAGGSRVLSAEGVPVAGAPVTGKARAVVRGGPGGVESTVRMWARRGFVLNVLPENAMVYVNDLLIGEVHQFNSVDEVYDFPETGSYTVRIVTPGGVQKTYVITAAEDAPQEIVRISAQL